MSLLGSIFKIGSSLLGGSSSKKASKAATAAQIAAINNGISTLNSQYQSAQGMSSPWVSGGTAANNALLQLLGISTPTQSTTDWAAYVQANPDLAQEWQRLASTGEFQSMADYGQFHYNKYGQNEGRDLSAYTTTTGGDADQASAIAALKESPLYQALFKNGVDTTLANASATGGLRGGNTQDALARVGTDTLARVYQNQISNLSGLSSTGLNAVTGIENLGANNASAIASLLKQSGDTTAGGTLQNSAINNNVLSSIAKNAGNIASSLFPKAF